MYTVKDTDFLKVRLMEVYITYIKFTVFGILSVLIKKNFYWWIDDPQYLNSVE